MIDIEKKILDLIKPSLSEYEYLRNIFSRIKDFVEKYMNERGVSVEVTLQGSVAHDTWLRGDKDIDVFVLFQKDIPVDELRGKYFKLLSEACSKLGLIEYRYAEHPYIRLKIDSIEADIVPAYKLDSPHEIKTAVDRTPFHTMYVNSRLTNTMKDEVRLLKKFMKSIGVYGAEIKTRGFSGYVVELLIIVYGSFRRVVEEASKWRAPVYINTLGDEVEFKKIIREMRRKYRESVIYMPDPVDPSRNAAANVSLSSLVKLVVASNCYLRNPDPVFFEESTRREISREELVKLIRDRCVVLLEFSIDEKLPPDVLWGELWRIGDRVVKVISNHGFNPIDYTVWSDEEKRAVVFIELDQCVKTSYKVYRGPEYWSADRVLDYISKHIRRGDIGPWIRVDGSILALGSRKYVDVGDLLTSRSWEYLVAPHFKNKKPVVKIISKDNVDNFLNDEIYPHLTNFVLKRPAWMEKCIDIMK